MKPTLHDIHIRQELQAGDLAYVIYLHAKMYQDEAGYGMSFEKYVADTIYEYYTQNLPDKNRVWICEYNEQIIGFMMLLNRGSVAQLRYFIILPEYRGIGLGNDLMSRFMRALVECGYESAYLLTTDGLPASAHLYRKFGFELIQESDSDAFGRQVKEQVYELKQPIGVGADT
jgi:N-acetylglutamate synthase-like GNAT family acetyltransferase